MGTSQTLALDEFLARLTPEDVAAIRSRVGVARLDQHKAAERDALTVARLGVRGAREAWLPHAGVPEWLRLAFVDTLRAWLEGVGRTCMHNPSPRRSEPLVAAAWRPGLVSCPPCSVYLLRLRGEADRTCDRCGRVVAGRPEDGEGIRPCRVTFGPLVYMYGVCDDCATEAPGASEVTR